jgi:uncharacterized phage protein gp47/JayE
MSGPYPLPTLAAEITSTGISAPSYADVWASLQASYKAIYGQDVYLDPDSQDGQMLAIFASAINDCNSTAIAVYNSFSPATAVGAGLSSNVKLNGMVRQSATPSSVSVTLVGQGQTTVTNGIVQNQYTGDQYALPASVTIPPTGQVTVTAYALQPGALTAQAGDISVIATPQLGWQTVTNASAASPGRDAETDAELRQRQTISTAIPALTPLESIVANVEALPGVTELKAYENDTSAPDANGLPSHSIALVVVGGDNTAIAETIAGGKLGCGTYGTTQVTVTDQNNVPDVIYFSRPTTGRIVVNMTIRAYPSYVSITTQAIETALMNWVNNEILIGGTVNLSDMIYAAYLTDAQGTYKFEPGDFLMSLFGQPLATNDIPMAWNEAPSLAQADITAAVVAITS